MNPVSAVKHSIGRIETSSYTTPQVVVVETKFDYVFGVIVSS